MLHLNNYTYNCILNEFIIKREELKSPGKLILDKLGICASAVCAVHCLVTPFIILLFPLAGLAFLESERLEIGFLALSFLLAVSSLLMSYLRRHRNSRPMLIAAIGIALFITGKMVSTETEETILSLVGGGLLIVAHYLNIKLSKRRAFR